MKIKQAMLVVITIVSFAMTTQAFAQGGSMQGCRCMTQMKNMMGQMNLTPDQRNKMKEMKQSMRTQMMSDKQKMQALRQQTHAMITSDKIDESALNDLISKKTAIVGERMKNRIMQQHQLYQMLTTEQKSKFKTKLDQMMPNKQNCHCG